jgi:hypothetical protein
MSSARSSSWRTQSQGQGTLPSIFRGPSPVRPHCRGQRWSLCVDVFLSSGVFHTRESRTDQGWRWACRSVLDNGPTPRKRWGLEICTSAWIMVHGWEEGEGQGHRIRTHATLHSPGLRRHWLIFRKVSEWWVREVGGHSTGQAQPVQDPPRLFPFRPLSRRFSPGQCRHHQLVRWDGDANLTWGPAPHHLICKQSLSQCNGRNDAAPLPRQRIVPPPPNSPNQPRERAAICRSGCGSICESASTLPRSPGNSSLLLLLLLLHTRGRPASRPLSVKKKTVTLDATTDLEGIS